MWGQNALDMTLWSAVFKRDKHSNQPCANLINIRINSLIVSDEPMRLAQFVSTNQISYGECSNYALNFQ